MLIIQLIRLNISETVCVLWLMCCWKYCKVCQLTPQLRKICPRCHMCDCVWGTGHTRSPAHGELSFFTFYFFNLSNFFSLVSALQWPPSHHNYTTWKNLKGLQTSVSVFCFREPILFLFLWRWRLWRLCSPTVWAIGCLGSHAAVIWHRQNLYRFKRENCRRHSLYCCTVCCS